MWALFEPKNIYFCPWLHSEMHRSLFWFVWEISMTATLVTTHKLMKSLERIVRSEPTPQSGHSARLRSRAVISILSLDVSLCQPIHSCSTSAHWRQRSSDNRVLWTIKNCVWLTIQRSNLRRWVCLNDIIFTVGNGTLWSIYLPCYTSHCKSKHIEHEVLESHRFSIDLPFICHFYTQI